MYNPSNYRTDKKNFVIENSEGGFLVKGTFPDGAGAYEAQWLIVEGVSVRTKLHSLMDE